MKNLVIILVIIGSIAGGSYIVDAVMTKQAVDSLASPNSAPALSESEAKAEFMGGCNTNEYDRQAEYCGCTYNQMRQKVTVNQLINDGLTLNQEQMQAKYQEEISYCLTTVYNIEEL